MSQCTNCAELQTEITRLRIQIETLLRIIKAARGECVTLANEAEQTMAGHVPRGVWAHATGQKETARTILERLA